MINKLLRYCNGLVYIKISGERFTDFINKALKENIVFYNTRKTNEEFLAEVSIKDFYRLRRNARDSGVRIKIRTRYGFPFVAARWLRRKGLLAGTLVFLISILIVSQFVLTISVEGNDSIPSEQIAAKAQELGIQKWVYMNKIDPDQLGTKMLENMPELAWISIEKRGTEIKIRVAEKTLPERTLLGGDLIAAKTGVVQDLMIIQGQAAVKEGDLVKTGQLLIKGTLSNVNEYTFDLAGSGNEVKKVLVAEGFVRGRVWYSKEVQISQEEDVLVETGQKASGWGIKKGDRVIMITNEHSPFSASKQESSIYNLPSWRNWRFPVEIICTRYLETDLLHIQRTKEEATKLAETTALDEIRSIIPPEAKIISERTIIMPSEQGIQRVRAEVESYEELAVYAKQK